MKALLFLQSGCARLNNIGEFNNYYWRLYMLMMTILGFLLIAAGVLGFLFHGDLVDWINDNVEYFFRKHTKENLSKGQKRFLTFLSVCVHILAFLALASLIVGGILCLAEADAARPRNYYMVTLNNGESYKVAEFEEPYRGNPYYRGIVNGKNVVFENIFSYEELEETYIVNQLCDK